MNIIPPFHHIQPASTALEAPQNAAKAGMEKPLQSTKAGVPGTVIDYSPQRSGIYIGSPSLAILPGGDYVASRDEFGPKSTENVLAVSHIFRSGDRGKTWSRIATLQGAFWSSLFVHRGALYLMGTDRGYGHVVIRRSDDGGRTWTTPRDPPTGLLRTDGKFHCAPVPVVVQGGRLWRAMEDAGAPGGWGSHFRAFMMSAPVEADLLRAESWTSSNPLARDAAWNANDFGGWLEGNAVATPDGQVVDVLRVDTRSSEEKAALVRISMDGKTSMFDPQNGLIAFPGGAKKFTIRYDAQSKLYWSLASIVPDAYRVPQPGTVRNTLALTSSPDLLRWTVRCLLLHHPDTVRHGFQYVDWLFDGEDIIAACRTAYEDGQGGAHNYHDANYLTFHRFARFRTLTMADSVPLSAHSSSLDRTAPPRSAP